MSTYTDIITAARLAFKSTDPERQRSGREWLRQLVAGLDETPAVPPLPDGFTYYGMGPLKVLNQASNQDVAYLTTSGWYVQNLMGSEDRHYALRTGSEIAKANGLP